MATAPPEPSDSSAFLSLAGVILFEPTIPLAPLQLWDFEGILFESTGGSTQKGFYIYNVLREGIA